MKLYRFSPFNSKQELLEAINYCHVACHRLHHKVFGFHRPVSQNLGIFTHYEEEFEALTQLRRELTEETINYKKKYFKLHDPIIIPSKDGIPTATYKYLYIRHPDPYRAQVGDVDFVLSRDEFIELKESLLGGKKMKGVRVFGRSDEEMIELHDPDFDVLSYLVDSTIEHKI